MNKDVLFLGLEVKGLYLESVANKRAKCKSLLRGGDVSGGRVFEKDTFISRKLKKSIWRKFILS